MPDKDGVPTASDVVKHLNARFEILALPYRIAHIAVLPYLNPMWMANWDVPQLEGEEPREVIEREIAEARWKFPQVLEDY